MNTFQLSCFLAVANTLSFAKAADLLNVSQPAISHQIKTLEAELNVKLFHRSNRFVELTAEGQSFISDAKSIVAISEQAKLRFQNSEEWPAERLMIGCSSHNHAMLVREVLHDLLGEYPNLHPHLMITNRDQLAQMLETEKVDVILDLWDAPEEKELCTHPLTGN